jgi:hypothetical protein
MMTMNDFVFKPDAPLENLEEVPEKYRGLYGENDEGQYVLSDAAKGIVGDYLGVSKSLLASRGDKKKVSDENAQRRLATKAFEELAEGLGLEPGDDGYAAALKSYVDDLTGKVKGGEAMKVNLDKVNAEHAKKMAALAEEKDNEISARDKALHEHLVRNEAVSALAKHKGSVELLLPHVEGKCKVVRDDNGKYTTRVLDDDGDYRTNAKGDFMSPAELVEEMKTKPTFKAGFESETPAGTGIVPGSMSKARPAGKQPVADMTATQKISAGLAKGQHSVGVGRGRVA